MSLISSTVFLVSSSWSVSFMDLDVQVSPQVWEILNHYVFKQAFFPVLPFSNSGCSIGNYVGPFDGPLHHADFLYFFHFMFSSNGVISKFLCSKSHIHSSVWSICSCCSLLHYFISFIGFFISTVSMWFFFMVSISLLSFSFVNLVFSWFCWIILLCFLIVHQISLQKLFWVLYLVIVYPCLWALLLEDYYDPLATSSVPDFSRSLEFYVSVFTSEVEFTCYNLY